MLSRLSGLVGSRGDAGLVRDGSVAGGAWRSHAEVWAAAGAVAGRLVAAGVRRGEVVGLALSDEADHLVAMVGLWRAGAVALPLDARFPDARLGFMCEDCGARVALADGEMAGRLAGLGLQVLGLQVLGMEGEAPRGCRPTPRTPILRPM